ncbi:laminin subunit beta-3 isoform X2 [Toxotes jaculatrix]|uniref:laminin subunit beta-3 isoform X2 n=1 Tax=Toxotes jaculatrix TaxID=941984 RepID=UPI001B3AAB57|nr:laminin subunit beta-3 isoform X2 [Toxotes jaculatrix]XP_040890795.1 laminin subunit beta-3 isoform X2 [Toxotes jaculatrix]
MRILLLLAAVAAVSQAQTDCSRGACYPPSNDLLVGRVQQLQASSTCGLTGSEVFCTPYQLRKMKCCPCDSRNPNGQLAHTIQEVLSTSRPDRWWQSRKDVSPVTLQLNLENLFQLDNLILRFKGPRPSAFVIEKTLDNGRTWQPALYLATDCQKAFPGVSTSTPLTLDETYCYTLPPTGSNPYQDHNIEFSPLRQYAYVPAPNSQKIEDASGLTGLRVRLTELGDVPRLPGRALSRFYALKEMRVMGSCMCHGHANRCLPETYNNPLSNKVNPQCDCQHNTAGVNCERCADLYNDLPWRPAEEGNTHTCQRCECNNHAQSCRFDPAVYEASGRRSGGVCEGCLHHTTGPKCDQCAPGYQPNPRSRMDRPDACIRCVCSAEGTVNGGRCDDSTGSCQCKVNVEGPRCDRCKRGYYGLSDSNPLGCTKCSCSPDGSLSNVCDPVTGQCPCRPHFHGLTCEVCSKGYWEPFQSGRCESCGCDPSRSYSDTCDQVTGQCQCRPGFGGRTCTECPENSYGDPLVGCRPCQCDTEGTFPEVCDKQTGACLCRPGITGTRCDSCGRGHCDSFPACDMCPSCFFTLDAQRQNLSMALERLYPRFPSRPGGAGDLGKFRLQIVALEASLNQIQDSISLPPSITRQVDNVLSQLDNLRDQVDKVNDNLSPLERTPGLDSELDKLKALLNGLTVLYKAKKDAMDNSISPNNAGAFSTIKNAYKESTDAANKVDASRDTVQESADTRKEAMDLQNQVQPANTRDLDKLNQNMASRPDLTPVAKQVCGSVRSEPCTPLHCEGGELCPLEGTPTCEKEGKCVGALPLSKRADADSKDVKDGLDKLAGKITEAAEKLQETQETTNQVRQTAEKLSNKITQTRDELEADLKETRDVVKELKDFLSDPTSNSTHIQEVSDWILNAKLPVSLPALKEKLKELKDLAANLPDSTAVLKEAEPQLDKARKLLEEAQIARDTALGVKADVDGLLAGFDSVEDSLTEMEGKLRNSTELLDNLTDSLTAAKDQLTPAEKALNDVSALKQPIKDQLEQLKRLLQSGDQQAQDAEENADKAETEAAAADEDLMSLEEQLDRLKDLAAASGPGGGSGQVADRLAKLQQGARALANTTENMMNALEGKADSLRQLQDEILQKSTKLEGLDARLKEILSELRRKAYVHATCQG